jgi:hypothetical protein
LAKTEIKNFQNFSKNMDVPINHGNTIGDGAVDIAVG